MNTDQSVTYKIKNAQNWVKRLTFTLKVEAIGFITV